MIAMKKYTLGILLFVVILAMVSAVSAFPSTVTATVSQPGPHPSYFDIKITSSADPLLPTGTYVGWCSDSQHHINVPFTGTFTAYSTLLTNPVPAGQPENWYKVNYIINNDAGKDFHSIQAAFWHYDGGPFTGWTFNAADYTTLTTAADLNPGFVPGCGQRYAVALIREGTQTIFLETTKTCENVPEFPSMALPVALLIGCIGVVYFVKTTREN
jgi:hypothetical protein